MPRNKKRRKLDHAVQEYGSEGFDPSVIAEAESLFRKSFTYERPEEEQWGLPPLERWFQESWADDDLREMEKELNEVKCSLSHHDITPWHEHTQQTNRAGAVIQYLRRHRKPELCTQAWCKFHEIVASYNIVPLDEPLFHSVHLCEAPGAFIASLNHYLVGRGYGGTWHWLGSTLNPHNEGNDTDAMIIEDRFIVDTLERWYFGVDNTGDVMDQANLDELVRVTQEAGPVHLVTADGSINFVDAPEEQERGTSQLHYCEVVSALHVLSPGGALVVKMFTLFEAMSASMLYLLNCVFKEVHVFKPATSKSGNSEVYIVAKDFRGMTSEQLVKLRDCVGPRPSASVLYSRDDLPESFLRQHHHCCHSFVQWQAQTIRENQTLFGKMTTESKERLESVRQCCAVTYIQRYDIRPIKGASRVVPLFKPVNVTHQPRHPVPLKLNRRHTGSFVDRQQQISLPWTQRLKAIKPFDFDASETRIIWLESHWGLHEHDILLWSPVKGSRLTQVKSSILCPMSVLKLWNLLREHCQEHSSGHGPDPAPSHTEEIIRELLEPKRDAGDKLQVLMLLELGPLLRRLLETEQVSLCTHQSYDECAATLVSVEDCVPVKFETPLEVTAKGRLLSNLISAFRILKEGDHLLVTFPGLTTRFSAGLFYVLYMTFTKVCILPPSPDSSLQTVVCACYRGVLPQLLSFLTDLQTTLVACEGTAQDVLQIMSIHNLYESNFHSYLETANDLHLKNWVNLMIRQQREFYHVVEEAAEVAAVT